MHNDLPLTTLQGDTTTLAAFEGNTLLIVNVASRCGLTPQYRGLQALHERFSERGLRVLGFPCNQFGAQEPGTHEEIAEFCSTNYGVSFPMFAKIDVNGPARHPLYQELTAIADEAGQAGDIRWNFEKFLVLPDGSIQRFRPQVAPDDPALIAALEAALS